MTKGFTKVIAKEDCVVEGHTFKKGAFMYTENPERFTEEKFIWENTSNEPISPKDQMFEISYLDEVIKKAARLEGIFSDLSAERSLEKSGEKKNNDHCAALFYLADKYLYDIIKELEKDTDKLKPFSSSLTQLRKIASVDFEDMKDDLSLLSSTATQLKQSLEFNNEFFEINSNSLTKGKRRIVSYAHELQRELDQSIIPEATCTSGIGNFKMIPLGGKEIGESLTSIHEKIINSNNEEDILGNIENINYPEVMNCLVKLINYSERLHKAQGEDSDVDDETKIVLCAEMDLHLATLRESFGLEDKRVREAKRQRDIGYVNFTDVSDKLNLLMKRASQLQRSTEIFGELFGPTQYEVIDVFAHMRGDILEVQRELDLSRVPEPATDEGSEEDNDTVYYLGKDDAQEQIRIVGVTGNMDVGFTHQHFIYDVFEPRQFDSYADAQVWLNQHIKKRFILPEDRLLDQEHYFKK